MHLDQEFVTMSFFLLYALMVDISAMIMHTRPAENEAAEAIELIGRTFITSGDLRSTYHNKTHRTPNPNKNPLQHHNYHFSEQYRQWNCQSMVGI